jgi:hypothetical protein
MENIPANADEVWIKLVEATNIEYPLQIKEYYNEVMKKKMKPIPRCLLTSRNHQT